MWSRLTILLTVLSINLLSSSSAFTITANSSKTTFTKITDISPIVISLASPSYDPEAVNVTSATKATTTTKFASVVAQTPTLKLEEENENEKKTITTTSTTSTTTKTPEESEKDNGLELAKMPTSTTQATEVTITTTTNTTTTNTTTMSVTKMKTMVEGQELRIIPEFKTREYKQIRCIYSKSKKIISCNNGQIECESTFFNFTAIDVEMFREFAIGFVPNQETVSIHELVKFYLYPRLGKAHYGNFTAQLGDTFYRTSIYFASDYFDDGLRVSDTECWAQVVDFFRRYDSHTRITIKSIYGDVDKIFTFGKLVILD